MTNFLDMLFILQLIAVLGISFYKLYNIMHKATKYDITISILLFIGFFIAWGFGLINIMFNYGSVIYIQIFLLETWFILLNVIFFFIEVVFFVLRQLPSRYVNYKANENRGDLN